MKMMGVGLSVAILVLLGERAWWPGRPAQPVGDQVLETEPGYEPVH